MSSADLGQVHWTHYDIVARIDGREVGRIEASRLDDRPSIGNVAVCPSHRRKGIGTRLVEKALLHAATVYSDEFLFLEVDAVNFEGSPDELRGFYDRIGFALCEVDWTARPVMRAALNRWRDSVRRVR